MLTSGMFAARLWRPLGWLAVSICAPAAAGTVNVDVVDEQGHALERVVVYLSPSAPAASASLAPPAAPTAAMDQQDNAFVPHILVVQKGTKVVFPNHDSVSHHVYSFSPAKTFELGLYKGNTHAPVLFEQSGLVVLGCNIHDGMLGYILIVDTPYFAMTDERGSVRIDGLPEGQYAVNVWTPRARSNQLPTGVLVDVAAAPGAEIELEVRGKLMPEHDHHSPSLSWERY
jgi:plastocyanin